MLPQDVSRQVNSEQVLVQNGIHSRRRAMDEMGVRDPELELTSGSIVVPVNCGQQPYDVIDITDSRAGLSGEKRRVCRLVLVYNPRRGEYWQRLLLGAV